MKNLYIFDCFGVVVTDVSTLFMKGRNFSDEQVCFMREDVFRKVDTGVYLLKDMFDIVSERFALDKEEIEKEWVSYEAVMPKTLELLQDLKRSGGTVALLSNASVGYVDYLFTKFDLYKYFDKLFVSAAYKTAKPDAEFYKLCVDGFAGEQFAGIYFTDDNPANLIGLERFGITPVLFTSADDVRKKLLK